MLCPKIIKLAYFNDKIFLGLDVDKISNNYPWSEIDLFYIDYNNWAQKLHNSECTQAQTLVSSDEQDLPRKHIHPF